VIQLARGESSPENFPRTFSPVTNFFRDTDLAQKLSAWTTKLWLTNEFIRVVKDVQNLEEFLPIPNWVIILQNSRKNEVNAVVVSSFEANELIPILKSAKSISHISVSMHMCSPKIRKNQRNFFTENALCIKSPKNLAVFTENDFIPVKIQLMILCGGLFFNNEDEAKEYANFLGILHRPFTQFQEISWNEGNIDREGFVLPDQRNSLAPHLIKTCPFQNNVISAVSLLIQLRGNEAFMRNSHAGKIITGHFDMSRDL